jgi:hypothetical protein
MDGRTEVARAARVHPGNGAWSVVVVDTNRSLDAWPRDLFHGGVGIRNNDVKGLGMIEIDSEGSAYLPEHIAQRLRAHSLSYVEVARAADTTSGAYFTEQMRRKRKMPLWLIERLTDLVAKIETGEIDPLDYRGHVQNLGGAYAGTPDEWEPPMADAPCQYRAGSEEKIEIMARRAQAGVAIHHPMDGKGVVAPDYRPGKGDALCP